MTKIIAEVCQNHGGSRETLSAMITAAAESGADYVKMQTIFSEDLTHRGQFDEGEIDDDGVTLTIKRPFAAEKERLSKLDLTEDDHRFFIDECGKHGVIPFTTVFSRNRIPFVASLPWPESVVKVASYDCASYPMIAELCEHFDHLIVSTGATFDEEIKKMADLVKSKGKRLSLLHCVTSYPNTLDMCNLKRMEWLRQLLRECDFSQDGWPASRSSPQASVGWSDHTLIERDGIKASLAAIAMGADFIERHFTILAKDQTKDGPVSVTPALLRQLAEFAKKDATEQKKIIAETVPEFAVMQGQETRAMTKTELLNRDYYRGRFASHVDGRIIHNWEDVPLPSR